MTATARRPEAAAPTHAPALDPARARSTAEAWVQEHLPDRVLVSARPHTAYYHREGVVSHRITVGLDAGADVTLLVHQDRCGGRPAAFPHDPDLPTLAPLLRPEVAEMLLVTHLGVPRPRWCTVTVVHHPRTGACVLRYDYADRSGGTDRHRVVFAKVYPTRVQAADAADRIRALGAHRLRAPDGTRVRFPRLLAELPERHTLLLESVSGGTRRPEPASPHAAGTALAALHRHRPTQDLPLVTAADHLAALDAELVLAADPWPVLAHRVSGALDGVRPVLARRAPGPPVLSHGDFTPNQVLRRDDGVAVIDLDTLRLAEPAADLGRYLAYQALSHVRARARGRDPRGSGRPDLLAGYGQPPVPRMELSSRVLAYRTLTLAHVALHAARRFKEGRTAHALSLLEHAPPTEGAAP